VKKLISLVFALLVMAALTLGCGYVSKETKVKCPKCGAVFTIDEGLKGMPPSGP
jgi:predicted Zn-ribbon and HTH transcriptional regulator